MEYDVCSQVSFSKVGEKTLYVVEDRIPRFYPGDLSLSILKVLQKWDTVNY